MKCDHEWIWSGVLRGTIDCFDCMLCGVERRCHPDGGETISSKVHEFVDSDNVIHLVCEDCNMEHDRGFCSKCGACYFAIKGKDIIDNFGHQGWFCRNCNFINQGWSG